MKLTTLLFTALLAPVLIGTGLLSSSANAEEARLQLTVAGIDPLQGQIGIAVFTDKESYKSGKGAVVEAMVKADAATVSAALKGLPAGDCAIKIYHDVNGNGELDTNLMGMPTEPFGFSNGAVARFGPPSFDKASFVLGAGDNTHTIKLIRIGG